MFTINFGKGTAAKCTGLFLLALVSCATVPSGESAPQWINDPYRVYDRATTIAAVGQGRSRDEAEKSALSMLSSIFGQSVGSESVTSYSYSQAVAASESVWSENSDIAQVVKTSVTMDTLVGAEIRDAYRGEDYWYAVAALDKAKTGMIYGGMIDQNLATIAALTNLSAAEKQNFEGIIKYYTAAVLADANQVFANVRNVISPGSMAGENLKPGADYRLAAGEIAKIIPVAVTVEGDKNNRIKGAFSGALAAAGFRTGGNGSRYALAAALNLEEIEYADNPYKWIRYVIDASLVDTSSGAVLFPWNINGREGHVSAAEAQNRAIQAAEKDIASKYAAGLSAYLSQGVKK
ncbi:MAG: LPP20 family lipoprotein [Treponema sp.]|jgi:hypothetical protein|nr:LPP20 family lipoprotein [Treponema sp.]